MVVNNWLWLREVMGERFMGESVVFRVPGSFLMSSNNSITWDKIRVRNYTSYSIIGTWYVCTKLHYVYRYTELTPQFIHLVSNPIGR